jgi:hypothetical protein
MKKLRAKGVKPYDSFGSDAEEIEKNVKLLVK